METETVKTVKHTPLPWISKEHKREGMISIQSQIPTEQQIAEEDCSIAGIWYGNKDEAKANAEFIVRACNSHYELLKCLKMIDECLSDGIQIEKNDPIHKVVKHLLTK